MFYFLRCLHALPCILLLASNFIANIFMPSSFSILHTMPRRKGGAGTPCEKALRVFSTFLDETQLAARGARVLI